MGQLRLSKLLFLRDVLQKKIGGLQGSTFSDHRITTQVSVPLCSRPVAYYIATWNSFLVFVIVMFTIDVIGIKYPLQQQAHGSGPLGNFIASS